jgi:predicted Ser/Thr protein kinase
VNSLGADPTSVEYLGKGAFGYVFKAKLGESYVAIKAIDKLNPK